MIRTIVLLAALAPACRKSSAPDHEASGAASKDPVKATSADPDSAQPSQRGPKPPVGVLEKEYPGDAGTAFAWRGVYRIDPKDPVIASYRQGNPDAHDWPPTLVAIQIFQDQYPSAMHTESGGFSVLLRNDTLDMLVFPGNDAEADPSRFTVTLMVVGG